MNKSAIYRWQTAYMSAVLEFDPQKMAIKVNEAVRVIHERMKQPLKLGGQEHRAIQDARTGIAMLTAEMGKQCVN
jgi:hypothetical protein